MSEIIDRFGICRLICGLTLALSVPPGAHAKAFRVLYAFAGGNDGAVPSGDLIVDKAGNLYGTTAQGGAHDNGAVFKLAPDGTETVLYSFQAENRDGARPYGRLLMDKAGNLYGTTFYGSGNACGCGAVFKLALDGTETLLYGFAGGSDGFGPAAGVIADRAGNLYGTTSEGGDLDGDSACFPNGCGTVFELAPDGTKTTLYEFAGPLTGSGDGSTPDAGVIADASGNLYGTTFAGGASYGGAVFKLAPDGTETVLHSFAGEDGLLPYAGLIADAAGNLYGTTTQGGVDHDDGAVFMLAPDGTETVLHSFVGGKTDGAYPYGSLVADRSGNLYGTTYGGGGSGCQPGYGCGTVFKLAPDGTETLLHSFREASDGAGPSAGLLADKRGNLYGVTSSGGEHGCGTVFEVKE
ncbi:MAG TPA: choice-of-anchor tandem repeat GloVer-containing protein [Stellaceae bacterium]|jgi:uncharacterized repeat protein (TIGR03803 family)|nr:choice-of-anchor tandem repeat GloVer-containing protein [Stellaceae bacterium]